MNYRKGTFIDYNYLVIILMFFVVFTTGVGLASEHIDGVSEITGVSPPTEIDACKLGALETDIVYSKGVDRTSWTEGINVDVELTRTQIYSVEEDDISEMIPEEPEQFVALEEWWILDITDGNYLEQNTFRRPAYYQVSGIARTEQIDVLSWTPPGTTIEVSLENLEDTTDDFSYVIDPENREEYFGWYTIEQEDIEINGENVDLNPESEIRFTLERIGDDFESPRLYATDIYAPHIEIDEGFIDRSLRMGRCAIAQSFNMFNIVTMQTGYLWIDMVLVPLQIILMFFIIKIVADTVSALPFT